MANPVTITGSGLRASPGTQGLVSFSGYNATILSWSDTQIQAIVPGNTNTGPVKVIASNGEASNYVNYTIPNLKVTGDSPRRVAHPLSVYQLIGFSIPHDDEGAPSFAESAVLVYALGAKISD